MDFPNRPATEAELHACQGGAGVAAASKVTRDVTGTRHAFPLVGRIGLAGFFRDRANDRPATAASATTGTVCGPTGCQF